MSEFKMTLPESVEFIINRMNSFGYSAHVVGGSVRDSLIGRDLGDFDITTNALPTETKQVFEGYRTVDTGIKHGTVTLVLDRVPYEITTYRVDGDYKDNRHPDSVSFTESLTEDLARRDFTVNAMAYSPSDGLVDPFGGRDDASLGILRAVGDPTVRFTEDALRILRALRFAAVLGFKIEDNTADAVRALANSLVNISKERVYTELEKLISGDNAYEVLLEYSDVLSVAFFGLTVKALPKKANFIEADYLTRLTSIIHLNSDDSRADAERILSSLKTDKFTRTYTNSVLSAYSEACFDTEKNTLRLLSRHGKEALLGALKLGIAEGVFGEREREVFYGALASGIPYTVSGLDLRGGDLNKIGIKGEAVGEALKSLLSAVIDGRVENSKDALISYFESGDLRTV